MRPQRNALPVRGYCVESAPVHRGNTHTLPHASATTAVTDIRASIAIDD